MGFGESTVWSVSVTVPYDSAWSKNRMWGRTRFGGVYMRKEAADHRDGLTRALRQAIGEAGVRVSNNDLCLDVAVTKADHKGDALNALDLISDAVEKATGLNDRWYHATVSWEIDRTNPHVTVRVWQPDGADIQICSACQRRLGYDAFAKDGGNKTTGRAGTCRGCQKRKREAAK